LYLLGVVALSGAFYGVGGRHHAVAIGPAPAAARTLALPDLVGTWEGAWADTVYAVGGTLRITVFRDGNVYGADGTIDVTSISPILGLLGGSANATETGGAISGTFSCTNLGDGSFSITESPGALQPLGLATGSGSVGIPLAFGPFTLSGLITDAAMAGTFVFTSPGGGAGSASLIKSVDAVQPSTWTEVKSRFQE
jgi:hypothetical protein